ncbi:MAG: hypothetical protein ACR2OU_03305, partial [Thermomicrobiales bacterium]
MTRTPPTPPFDDLDDDQFNTAFEALLRGDGRSHHTGPAKLDPEMESTIDQLFDWANTSGFADEPVALFSHEHPDTDAGAHRSRSSGADAVTADRMQIPPTPIGVSQRRPSQHHSQNHKMRRFIMSTFSGLTAAILIGFGIYGA